MDTDKIIEKSDADLVGEFQRGVESAFDQLVKRHMTRAVQLAAVMVGNYEDARDLSQEAFVKAHRSLKQFEGKAKFSTWLYRIVINSAKDHLRRRRLRNFLKWETGEAMENFFEKVRDPAVSPSHSFISGELGRHMTQAIRKLPFKQQAIFTLRFVEGLSIGEISEATGTAEGTVKASLHFAVRKFREEISPYLKGGE